MGAGAAAACMDESALWAVTWTPLISSMRVGCNLEQQWQPHGASRNPSKRVCWPAMPRNCLLAAHLPRSIFLQVQ
jgi:hypothetical protein